MQTFPLAANAGTPNNPRLPARLYPAVLKGHSAAQVQRHLQQRGWTGAWQDIIYDYHHYHTTAHEVLVVLSGWARVVLGGEGGPVLKVWEGDLLLLPAGVGHCSLEHSDDFLVMGAYAEGRNCDLCRPEDTDLAWAQARIAAVPDWANDPA